MNTTEYTSQLPNAHHGLIVKGSVAELIVTSKGDKETYYRVSSGSVAALPSEVVLKAQKDKRDFIAVVPKTSIEGLLEHIAANSENLKAISFYTGLIEEAQRKLMIKAFNSQSEVFDYSLDACVEAANQENTRQRSVLTMSGEDFKLINPDLLARLVKHYSDIGKQVTLKQVSDLLSQIKAGFASEKSTMPEGLVVLLEKVTSDMANPQVSLIVKAKRELLSVSSDMF